MSHIEDILFAPILPPGGEEKLREIVKRVMVSPRSDENTDRGSREIVDLLRRYGFTDDQEIADIVRRVIQEILATV